MSDVDWSLVRSEFESTLRPIAAIVRERGVGRATLLRRAATESWENPRQRPPPPADPELSMPQPPQACSLSRREQLFVAEYLICLDATLAALNTGIEATTAEAEGRRLMENAQVRAAIDDGLAARIARAGITADRVLQELARIGFAVITDFTTWTDDQITLKNSTSLTRDQAAAITELTRTRDGVRIKFDKLPALNALARYLGLPGSAQPAAGLDRDGPVVIRPDEPIPDEPVL